jgi:hypothetical protein
MSFLVNLDTAVAEHVDGERELAEVASCFISVFVAARQMRLHVFCSLCVDQAMEWCEVTRMVFSRTVLA